ncbi:hypothetical protein HA466_0312480 [Hirschfeldia incana]|nr:hypothetical protein HA466_0312480 [Hirschfeldia incana]
MFLTDTLPGDRLLLEGVKGAPLALVHVSSSDPLPRLSIKHTPIIKRLVSNISHATALMEKGQMVMRATKV